MKIQQTWYLWACAVLLLVALGDNAYSYYQLLRWAVCAGALFAAYSAHQSQENGWTWTFVVLAVLFNPIAPFTLARATWQLFDIAAAIIFGVYALHAKKTELV